MDTFYPKVNMLIDVIQARSQQEIFLGGARANYGGTKLFAYSNENDGIKCLYRYYTRTPILIITSRRVFSEFIMGNKYEVLGFKAKLWGSGAEPSVFGVFCSFLIKLSHFEAYLILNFYKNLFLSL